MTKGVPADGRFRQTAADEVDHLEAITRLKNRLVPPIPRHDIAVEFDGDAVWLHAELLDKSGKGEGAQ